MINFPNVESITDSAGKSVAKILDSSGKVLWSKAPSYDPVFANNTWEQIIAACQANEVPDTWKVGHQKLMTINGVNRRIDIIGKKHDPYWVSGIAPLTFQVHDLLSTDMYAMYDTLDDLNGWTGSSMRHSYLATFMGGMPTSVRQAIKTVKKNTNVGNGVYDMQYTPDTLFLLSEYEVTGKHTNTASLEGRQYEYYKIGGTAAMIKVDETGEYLTWWLRSPDYYDDTRFCFVNDDGDVGTTKVTTERHIAPAFCF